LVAGVHWGRARWGWWKSWNEFLRADFGEFGSGLRFGQAVGGLGRFLRVGQKVGYPGVRDRIFRPGNRLLQIFLWGVVVFLLVEKFLVFGILSFVFRSWLRNRISVCNPAQDLLGLSWLLEQSFGGLIGIAFLMPIGSLGFVF
jgi:hypothetical protein